MAARVIDLAAGRRTVAVMRNLYAVLPCVAAAGLVLAACSVTYGNKAVASASSYEGLKPGRAAKADVYEALGQPSDVLEMEKGVLWTYRYRKAKNNLQYPPVWRGADRRRQKWRRLYRSGPL